MSSTMVRILQTGTFNSMNKGDAAMQISMADALAHDIPSAKVLISTPFPDLDRDFYKDYELVICSRRRLIWASFQLLRAMLWGLFDRVGLKLNWLVPERELQEYLKADLVVDLSGDMLTEDYGPHVAYSHYLPLLLAIMLRRPFVACAQSIGPFGLTKPLARFILNKAQFITTRDQISMDYLLGMGIRPELLTKTADMAFLLRPAPRDKALALLEKEGFTPDSQRPLMGMSLSRLVESKYTRKNLNAASQDMVDLFASVLDEASEKYGVDIVFIPHVTGPAASKDDRRIHAEVQASMHARSHVITGEYTPSELKSVIGLCETMFGARMHANIGALSSGIPTLAIAYSHKTPGIMSVLGQSELVLDISTLNRQAVMEKLAYLHAQKDAIKQALDEARTRVEAASQVSVDMIAKLVSGLSYSGNNRQP